MAKRKSPAKKAVSKKRAQAKKVTAKPSNSKPEEEIAAPKPPEYGILVYLRNPSRTWPVKIGPYRYNKDYVLWLYTGKPIAVDEWNKSGEEALDDISKNYDYLPSPVPGFKFIELPPEESEDPAWKKNLEKAHNQKKIPPKESVKKEEENTDERPGTQGGSSSQSLY